MYSYDVIVVGGGFTGVAAALAAARKNLKVLLVEAGGSLGGAAVNNLVLPFMQYWTNVKKEDGSTERLLLSNGIFTEIREELAKLSKQDSDTFNEEVLKLVLQRMVLKEGVKLLFHSYLVSAEKDGKTVKSITVANKSGLMRLEANYFVDATGDADLATACNCETVLGREPDHLCQPMTLCFRISNIDFERSAKDSEKTNRLYKEYQKQGKIRNPREDILIFNTQSANTLHFNSTRVVKKNPVDAFDLTDAEIEAREQVWELYTYMRDNIDGFQDSDLITSAASIGVRESRMLVGQHVLTGEELVACTKFEDSIAAGNYDIDIHNPEGSGTSHYYFPEGEYYTIPYRSLLPKETDNLLVAGRCISVTHEAQASVRIMPICCTMGEAAGTAIGVAAESSCAVDAVDVKEVQKRLRENGAFC